MEEVNDVDKKNIKTTELPCGKLCGYNCTAKNGCAYWEPFKRDNNGRQYCRHYKKYFYPQERQGCLSFK